MEIKFKKLDNSTKSFRCLHMWLQNFAGRELPKPKDSIDSTKRMKSISLHNTNKKKKYEEQKILLIKINNDSKQEIWKKS